MLAITGTSCRAHSRPPRQQLALQLLRYSNSSTLHKVSEYTYSSGIVESYFASTFTIYINTLVKPLCKNRMFIYEYLRPCFKHLILKTELKSKKNNSKGW